MSMRIITPPNDVHPDTREGWISRFLEICGTGNCQEVPSSDDGSWARFHFLGTGAVAEFEWRQMTPMTAALSAATLELLRYSPTAPQLPGRIDRWLTPTEIGERFGFSAQAVGMSANRMGLKNAGMERGVEYYEAPNPHVRGGKVRCRRFRPDIVGLIADELRSRQ